jgi:hypothetical protein
MQHRIQSCCLATFNRKGKNFILVEIMRATIDFNFKFFPFQIVVSNAVVVPVHHSSFGSSSNAVVVPVHCSLFGSSPLCHLQTSTSATASVA